MVFAQSLYRILFSFTNSLGKLWDFFKYVLILKRVGTETGQQDKDWTFIAFVW